MPNLLNPQLYDTLADEFADHSDSSAFNAHYERPAMLELLGDVRGMRVLDIGCGAGPLLGILAHRGAGELAGIEVSPRLVALARKRLPPKVTMYCGEVADTLSCLLRASDGMRFDCIVASLVIHYIDDLESLFELVAKALRPGGRFLLSTNVSRDAGLSKRILAERWPSFGVDVARYERSEDEVRTKLVEAGFGTVRTFVPLPSATMRDVDRESFARVSATPDFLFIEARDVQGCSKYIT